MQTDIEIAESAKVRNITEIAALFVIREIGHAGHLIEEMDLR